MHPTATVRALSVPGAALKAGGGLILGLTVSGDTLIQASAALLAALIAAVAALVIAAYQRRSERQRKNAEAELWRAKADEYAGLVNRIRDEQEQDLRRRADALEKELRELRRGHTGE